MEYEEFAPGTVFLRQLQSGFSEHYGEVKILHNAMGRLEAVEVRQESIVVVIPWENVAYVEYNLEGRTD
ncbi:MAG: hypothetical protein KY468_11085 [Armatimonadetes bacterium]|nr:hypothetical protein [Armatimonadota bacterium]